LGEIGISFSDIFNTFFIL